MYTAFFYGTLCVPEILKRVIGNDGSHLTTENAVLSDHIRLKVKGEDYPALVTLEYAAKIVPFILGGDLQARVQGVVVHGLTEEELDLLDEFEGDEYEQDYCTPVSLTDATKQYPDTIVYRWIGAPYQLLMDLWTLEYFIQEQAYRWTGPLGEKQYFEVDQRRGTLKLAPPPGSKQAVKKPLNGTKSEEDGQSYYASTGEKFGRPLRERYWNFEEGWVNLNHGSYGSAPRPVVDDFLAIREKIDKAPDRFMRLEYETELIKLRSRLAEFVDCDTDDLVIVPNATMGVNTALMSLTNEWQKGDKLLYFDTTIYYACKTTLQHIVNTHLHLDLSLLPIPVTYPISHSDLIDKTRQAIEEAEKDGKCKVRLALIDGISSNPGVIVPWEKLVDLFREKNVYSLVDAAHNIGQQLHVSLRTSQPDFWISNCHKWLLAHRGCAILHVNKRNQHLVHSIPISHFYAVRTQENASEWVNEFIWTGTPDWSPILSTLAALDFRKDVLGGEEKIQRWCHNLAIEGGERVAKILGTRTMRNEKEEDGELVPNMIPPPLEGDRLKSFWYRTLVDKYHTVVPFFPHGALPWVRLSAQVYTDLDDFEYVGQALKEVCEAIERGEHLQDSERAEKGITGAEEDE
ncbi:hypothetical protein JCM5353_005150 [Sporobolomyces roseus]